MDLELQGQRIIQERLDFALSLHTDTGYEIHIETDFSLHTPGGDFSFSPESGIDQEKYRPLLDKTISSSTAKESGVLDLGFTDGATLRVKPNETYEAWTVAGPHVRKVVCMPRGELAIWSDRSLSDDAVAMPS